MDFHDTPTHRRFLGSLVGLAGISAAGFSALSGGSSRATGSTLMTSAAATEHAVRTRLDDLLSFPVRVGEGLITLNNFGGRSVSTGA